MIASQLRTHWHDTWYQAQQALCAVRSVRRACLQSFMYMPLLLAGIDNNRVHWLLPQGPYRAVGQALEVIPRTLAQNCGANVIRTLTKLRAKHADPAGSTFGIDGNAGARCCTHPVRDVPVRLPIACCVLAKDTCQAYREHDAMTGVCCWSDTCIGQPSKTLSCPIPLKVCRDSLE